MEVMEHYLPDFPMNLSILLFLMGLLNLTTLEDFPEKSDHREGIIIKGSQESRFPQGNLHEALFTPSTCRWPAFQEHIRAKMTK